ncbi:hypothetical protein E2C01_063110 [Portunus trituberculatus]|uniref:Uncharacterized protein n=1 Tax=Portunus trituberculatus TaxID=210409 RepID=A0A5B7HGM3_PORTR|nr:hypothetical protein [Portunus trituberculatus]
MDETFPLLRLAATSSRPPFSLLFLPFFYLFLMSRRRSSPESQVSEGKPGARSEEWYSIAKATTNTITTITTTSTITAIAITNTTTSPRMPLGTSPPLVEVVGGGAPVP